MQGSQVRSLVGELRSHILQLSLYAVTTELVYLRACVPQLEKPMHSQGKAGVQAVQTQHSQKNK